MTDAHRRFTISPESLRERSRDIAEAFSSTWG